jgi:hypothetical protein
MALRTSNGIAMETNYKDQSTPVRSSLWRDIFASVSGETVALESYKMNWHDSPAKVDK